MELPDEVLRERLVFEQGEKRRKRDGRSVGVNIVGAGRILGASGSSVRSDLAAGQFESHGNVVRGAANLVGKVLVVANKSPVADDEHKLGGDVHLSLLLCLGAGRNRGFFLEDGQLLVQVAGRAFFPILEQKAFQFYFCGKLWVQRERGLCIARGPHKRIKAVFAHLFAVSKFGVPFAQQFLNKAGDEASSDDWVVAEEGHGRGNVKERLALRNVGLRRVLDVQSERSTRQPGRARWNTKKDKTSAAFLQWRWIASLNGHF